MGFGRIPAVLHRAPFLTAVRSDEGFTMTTTTTANDYRIERPTMRLVLSDMRIPASVCRPKSGARVC